MEPSKKESEISKKWRQIETKRTLLGYLWPKFGRFRDPYGLFQETYSSQAQKLKKITYSSWIAPPSSIFIDFLHC